MEYDFDPTFSGDTNVPSVAEREHEEIDSTSVPRASGTPSSSQGTTSQAGVPRVSCFCMLGLLKKKESFKSMFIEHMAMENTLFKHIPNLYL